MAQPRSRQYWEADATGELAMKPLALPFPLCHTYVNHKYRVIFIIHPKRWASWACACVVGERVLPFMLCTSYCAPEWHSCLWLSLWRGRCFHSWSPAGRPHSMHSSTPHSLQTAEHGTANNTPYPPQMPPPTPLHCSASTATKRYMTLCRLEQTDSCLSPLEDAAELVPLLEKWQEYFVFTFVSGWLGLAGCGCSCGWAVH